MGLCDDLLKAVSAMGYKHPSPIQTRAIPAILSGRDIFGCAQTGTGKTAAFALPIMQKLESEGKFPKPSQFRALILTPTRELAEQIGANISMFGKHLNLSYCKAYGGVSEKPQVKMLSQGVDILVATPGRLLDLFSRKKLSFDGVEFLVLDEADRMLDMGFIPDIRRICAQLPSKRQSLLFSATMGDEIEKLARTIVINPLKITISPDSPTVEKIDQRVATIESVDKYNFLIELLQPKAEDKNFLALVFCRTKHGASKLAKRLSKEGIPADSIHGDKSQSARQKALGKFKDRTITVLVATDIAARGIDVKNMDMVVNYDLPEDPETYVHRIGRTARAEASGAAVSICTRDNVQEFSAIEKFAKINIPILKDTQFFSENVAELVEKNRAFRAKMAGKKQPQRPPKQPKDKDFAAEILYGERRPTAFLERENPHGAKPPKKFGIRSAKSDFKKNQKRDNFEKGNSATDVKREFDERRHASRRAAAEFDRQRAHGAKRQFAGAEKFRSHSFGKPDGRGAASKGGAKTSHKKAFSGTQRPQKQKRLRKNFVNNV